MSKSTPKAHPTQDEYNWEVYTQEYSAQVDEMERTAGHNGSDFLVRRWGRKPDGSLELLDNLHGNWKGIYSAIDEAKPESVFECGCGGMYHLKNIKTLFPDIEVSGCDLLQTQIDFGAKKFAVEQEVLKNVSVRDFTKPDATNNLGRYDFVYSHAVMMHLSGERGIDFLRNMMKISKKHVFFIEGPQHDYMELVVKLGEVNNWDVTKPRAHNSWLLTRR
jgi:SAM-dependent methyltransferase